MHPWDFHDCAQRLADSGSTAADFRSAVSRAYYAVYHGAHGLLMSLGLAPATDKWAHDDVRDHFQNSNCTVLERLSTMMGDLHGKRLDADYKLEGNTFILEGEGCSI